MNHPIGIKLSLRRQSGHSLRGTLAAANARTGMNPSCYKTAPPKTGLKTGLGRCSSVARQSYRRADRWIEQVEERVVSA